MAFGHCTAVDPWCTWITEACRASRSIFGETRDTDRWVMRSRGFQRFGQQLFARQRRLHAALDGVAWTVAIVVAVLLRLDFDLGRVHESRLAGMVLIAVAAQISIGGMTGLYAGRWRSGSFDEVAALVRATAIQTVFL